MELVIVFTGMAALSFGIALGSAIAERCGRNVGALPADATANAADFISLALVGLLFV